MAKIQHLRPFAGKVKRGAVADFLGDSGLLARLQL
jgi:hypothetical protein